MRLYLPYPVLFLGVLGSDLGFQGGACSVKVELLKLSNAQFSEFFIKMLTLIGIIRTAIDPSQGLVIADFGANAAYR